eukprot:TRINITY_DN6922_c0_g1_i2.p1 TRINITY_DN6922_c0_g1~~TRINITY_DN6922_c0_g1_i2.p1  ORF type:complete len:579 (-),score=137.32 TRINITY_DN6922_c0_g1_i2:246-1913(-)
MDFMKALDQTVREIKREVNMKILKVPEIEQKVLDATSNEPWGPHGSDLAEIAQATKKFTECTMVMNVLWTRLTDTGRNWRHVYKALAVIEYLVANGSERAVDDIIEHTFQISSISGFEYVEPNGKDTGINVRKKVEIILALLNDKDKIEQVRNKAAANRDKYVGVSSTGTTYKSNSASYGSGGFQNNDRYGGPRGAKEGDMFKDSYKERDQYGEETDWNHGKDGCEKSRRGPTNENESSKNGLAHSGRVRDAPSSSFSRASTKVSYSDDNYGPVASSESLSTPPNNMDDDFDDFDPRGSSTTGSAAAKFNQVDLFGGSLIGDLMDAPTSIPTGITSTNTSVTPEVDLFADATFVSASPHIEAGTSSHTQANVDLFAHQTSSPVAISSPVDLFAAPNPVLPTETKSSKTEFVKPSTIDPFAAVPLNNFGESDIFGDFTSHTDSVSTVPTQSSINEGLNNLNQNTLTEAKPPPKKDTFQVKSGIWADSLSRGLIDLNISAPKKTSLADIGIVGGLSDGSDDKEKGPPPTSVYMGRAMGLGRSGYTSTGNGGDLSFFK